MPIYRNGHTFKAILVRSILHHMCAHHDKDQKSKGVPKSYHSCMSHLVMGLSLAVVILLWVWIGHIGP